MRAQLIQWEMYHRGSVVEFRGVREPNGYELQIVRDEQVLATDVAPDAATLLRKSSELRERLQQLGFGAKPDPVRASQLVGGPCWGPATPLQSSLLEALRA